MHFTVLLQGRKSIRGVTEGETLKCQQNDTSAFAYRRKITQIEESTEKQRALPPGLVRLERLSERLEKALSPFPMFSHLRGEECLSAHFA